MGQVREYPCPHCGAAVRPSMVRCRDCGQIILEEGLTLEQSSRPAVPKPDPVAPAAPVTEQPAVANVDDEPFFVMAEYDEQEQPRSAEVVSHAPSDVADETADDDQPKRTRITAGESHQPEGKPTHRPRLDLSKVPLVPTLIAICSTCVILAALLFVRMRDRGADTADNLIADASPNTTSESPSAVPNSVETPVDAAPDPTGAVVPDAIPATAVEQQPAEPKAEPDPEPREKPAAAVAKQVEPVDAPPAEPIADVIDHVEKAVVTLHVKTEDGKTVTGSGFLCRDQKTIVTNFHVVEGAISATVEFFNGDEVPIAGFEIAVPDHDLAVLQINLAFQAGEPLRLVNGKPKRGTDVVAFGSPKGLSGTVSSGVVSAIRVYGDLSDDIAGATGGTLSKDRNVDSVWIQTTAPISNGNSGGPLVSRLTGEVIGMNTWSLRETQNLNFALAASDIAIHLPKAPAATKSLLNLPEPLLPDSPAPTASDTEVWIAKIQDLDRERDRLLREKKLADGKLALAETERDFWQAKLNTAQAQLQTANQELSRLDGQARTLQQKLSNTADALSRSRLQGELKLLATEFQLRQGIQTTAKADVASCTGPLRTATKDVASAQSELDKLQREADELRDQWIAVVDPFGVRARGQTDLAVELFSEWIRRDADFAPAYIARGLTYSLDLDQHALAAKDVDKAIQIDPKLGAALAAKAFVLFRSGQRTQARMQFNKARSFGRNDSMVYLLQGRFHHETGQFTRAKGDYRKAMSLNQEDATASIWYADLCATCPEDKVRDADEALKLAEGAVKQTGGKRWDALLAYASALAEAGRFVDAAKQAEAAVALAPALEEDACKSRLEAFRKQTPWRIPATDAD